MRARNVLLALLIIIVGMGITASRRGVPAEMLRTAHDLGDLVAAFSDACEDFGAWREVSRSDTSVPVAGAAALEIVNPNGAVIVTGGEDPQQVRVQVTRFGRGRAAKEAAAAARQARLETSRSADMIILTVTGPRRLWRRARLDLRIIAPVNLDLDIKAASGAVEVRAMQGSVKVTAASADVNVTGAGAATISSASGGVRLGDIAGPVNARVVSGWMRLEDIAGEVEAAAVSGDIHAARLRGPVSASTVSGSVILQDYVGPEARLKTTSGDLAASLAAPLVGRFTAHAISGDIAVVLPPGCDCAVDLASTSGDIRSDLALRRLETARRRLTGLLGAGRGRLELHTVSGDIEVRHAASAGHD